ncbi:hypothetical protein K1T71_014967 [Dendrolimus kikuchii]|nr:hypothetical protein K1T71_014967 [Dendrolimus kikuchii]
MYLRSRMEAGQRGRQRWPDTGSAPPQGQDAPVTTQSSGRGDDLSTLRAERDALARALAAERQRAATAARAHDARLAELHGVIAELVRRRAGERHRGAIPEEEVSDECESTTQPAGELDNDADRSRTFQNDTSSLASPAELPTPQEPKVDNQELRDDTTDTRGTELRLDRPKVVVTSPQTQQENCDTSLNLSERDDSDNCLNTARCCHRQVDSGSGIDSCERERGSNDAPVYMTSTGRCESRQAKLASRVRLRRTEDSDSNNHLSNEEAWCAEAAEKLALDVCAQADLREALIAATNDGGHACASWCAWRVRSLRLHADLRVAQCALARASDTAHRLYTSCSVQESCCVSLCGALKAADRALETYDVLLALAETAHAHTPEREAAELVARQLLTRLENEDMSASIGEPLLSPGPWLRHQHQLKAHTVALRTTAPPPHLFSYHGETGSILRRFLSSSRSLAFIHDRPSESARSRRRRERHWLETQASETDL